MKIKVVSIKIWDEPEQSKVFSLIQSSFANFSRLLVYIYILLVMKQITQLNRTLYNSVLCLFSTLEGWRLKFIAAGFEFRISRNETKYCKTETRKRTFSSRVWLIMYSREKYIHRKLFHLSCGKYFIWQPFILDVFPNLFFVCFPSSILKLCSSNIPGNKQRATFLKLSSLRQYFKTRENCYAR